jgi:hypothetical protein
MMQGIFCEHSCPVGTEEDYLAVRADHNIEKFPNSRYREDTDGVMTGKVCSGHGVCDDKGDCSCEECVFSMFSSERTYTNPCSRSSPGSGMESAASTCARGITLSSIAATTGSAFTIPASKSRRSANVTRISRLTRIRSPRKMRWTNATSRGYRFNPTGGALILMPTEGSMIATWQDSAVCVRTKPVLVASTRSLCR